MEHRGLVLSVMSSFAAPAVAPLAAALLALFVTAATGFDQRTPLPSAIDAVFYGFFLDRYPLFAVAIVYGLARLLAAATAPGPVLRRAIGWAIGTGLVLAASLYPTFGGLVLRGGFATGGVAFLNQLPMAAAYALGAATAAVTFGAALGLGVLLIGRGKRPPLGWRRALAAPLLGFLALWFAFAILGLARDAGLGPWPRRPLNGTDVTLAAALVLAAFLPHAVLVARDERTGPRTL